MCRKSFKTVISVAVTFALWGCTLSGSLMRDHELACKAQAKVVIHNHDLWNQYVLGADQAFHDRQRDFGEKAERSLIEAVPGYEMRFGSDLEERSTYKPGEIVRDDIFFLKDDVIVAQFIDFTVAYEAVHGLSGLRCTGRFPDLYLIKGKRP